MLCGVDYRPSRGNLGLEEERLYFRRAYMQPTEPSFPGSGLSGGTAVAVSEVIAESPGQPSASEIMAPAEELLDVGEADSLDPDIGSDSASKDNYHSTIVESLKALVSDEPPRQEVTEETTQEICRLLIKRLPESACGQEDAIAPIRANLWSAMLLGLRPEDLNRQACACLWFVCIHTLSSCCLRLLPTDCCTVWWWWANARLQLRWRGGKQGKQDHLFSLFVCLLPPAGSSTGSPPVFLCFFFYARSQLLNARRFA